VILNIGQQTFYQWIFRSWARRRRVGWVQQVHGRGSGVQGQSN